MDGMELKRESASWFQITGYFYNLIGVKAYVIVIASFFITK